jgi:hypothetical protein
MSLAYLNTTNNSAVVLIDRKSVLDTATNRRNITFSAERVVNISLCNKHATDSVTVDLWIRKYTDNNVGGETETNFYILNNVLIPNGASLVLGRESGINFNNTDRKLYIQLSASDSAVDVIIK